MTFALWETESGNVIGGYETADAALEAVPHRSCASRLLRMAHACSLRRHDDELVEMILV